MGAGALFLGVSRSTLWRMIQAGILPRVEVLPGSFRVRRADLQAFAAMTNHITRNPRMNFKHNEAETT